MDCSNNTCKVRNYNWFFESVGHIKTIISCGKRRYQWMTRSKSSAENVHFGMHKNSLFELLSGQIKKKHSILFDNLKCSAAQQQCILQKVWLHEVLHGLFHFTRQMIPRIPLTLALDFNSWCNAYSCLQSSLSKLWSSEITTENFN